MNGVVVGTLISLGLLVAAGGIAAYWGIRRLRFVQGELRVAEGRADALAREQDRAPVGRLSIYNDDGRVIGSASSRLQHMLGLPAGEISMDALLGCFEAGGGARLADICADPSRADEPRGLTLGPSLDGQWYRVYGQRVSEDTGRAAILWFADVTPDVEARSKAQGEADRLNAIFDALPMPVWFRDSGLSVQDGNAAYAYAVGMSRAVIRQEGPELLGSGFREVGRGLAGRARDRGAMVSEQHHVVVHGSRRLLELQEIPIGENRMLGLAIDRTREEELEGRLSRHVSAHAEVLESLNTAIVIFASDLRVRFYNGAYANLWGLDATFLDTEPHVTEILDQLREKRVLPEQSDFPAYKRESVDKLRNLVQTEEELVHRPDERTLKLTRTPHPFGGVLITYEDVTDRLTLERNFNTLIEVQRETIENLHEAVAVYGPDGRLKLNNHVFLDLWGLTDTDLGEQPHLREVVAAARGRFPVKDANWDHLKERLVVRASEPEARRGRIELTDRTVLDWAQVPLPDGQSLFTYLDVTDTFRVERALRERAEALETADQLKSEFIANISYELRTPLNAIVGFAQILEKEFHGELNERQREYANAISASSQGLTSLINDILDLANIEAGYLELDREPLRMAELLNSVRSLAYERARHRGLVLKIECPDPDAEFLGDPQRLRQALYNLMSNAFNFTSEGGRVRLRGERVGDEVHISVSDTGAGIPESEQERVFAKFERGDNKSGGAGLGLSLVSSLIQLHGGRVVLESKPGRGTRVTCALPVTPVARDPEITLVNSGATDAA